MTVPITGSRRDEVRSGPSSDGRPAVASGQQVLEFVRVAAPALLMFALRKAPDINSAGEHLEHAGPAPSRGSPRRDDRSRPGP